MALAQPAATKSNSYEAGKGLDHAALTAESPQSSSIRTSLRSPNSRPIHRLRPIQPVQPSLSPVTPISETVCTKRKYSRGSESRSKRPARQTRRRTPSQTYFEAGAEAYDRVPPPLSDEAQEGLQSLYTDVMNFAAATTTPLKRSLSRHSVVKSETSTTQSQRSSSTAAHYRYKQLRKAHVYIHSDPPNHIRTAIDHIIGAQPPEDRRVALRGRAEAFQKKCKKMVQAAAGEDDFVNLFHSIIEDMSPDSLISRQKADWRVELKPETLRFNGDWTFLQDLVPAGGNEQQRIDDTEVDDALALPPSKRYQQLVGRRYISPENSRDPVSDSRPDNNPPTRLKVKDTSLIKTPRPDITTGIEMSVVISALTSSLAPLDSTYTQAWAEKFLETLQDTPIPGVRDAPSEPALIMVPTQRDTGITFPTLVFEGKGYSTGKQIFEAKNQAAVSGAGGLKIQMMLDELVKRATQSSTVVPIPSECQPPLVFAICSEGPQHELWAQYSIMKDGEHQFHMVLLDACHGVVPKQVEQFLTQVDNILNWTAGPFLQSVVDRLGKVATKSREAMTQSASRLS